jgi:hypothetical protein
LGWEQSPDWLRKNLVELREDKWIDYESWPGQQRPYSIRLRGAAVDWEETSAPISDAISAGGDTAHAEAASEHWLGGENRVPLPEPLREVAPPQTGIAPLHKTRRDADDGELETLLAPFGALSSSQRAEFATAWAQQPDGVRACLRTALSGRSPAGLLTRLIRDGEHLRIGRSRAGGWVVDAFVRHPTDPELDDLTTLGPFETRNEAEAAARPLEHATVRRLEST